MSDDMTDDDGNSDVSVQETRTEWKAPTSQEELDRIIASRVSRIQRRYADYDSLKEKAARADALDSELASDKDKAVRAAQEQTRAEVLSTTTPRLVRAEFRAAAKGVLSNEQLDSLLEDVDLNRFVTDKGDVDEERIAKKISALVPPPAEETPKFPDLGGGRRGTNSTATNMNQLIRQKAGLG